MARWRGAVRALADRATEPDRPRAGRAEITERRSEFTDSDDWNTDATSGSRTTASVFFSTSATNRFGLDFE